MVGIHCLTAVTIYWNMPPIFGPTPSVDVAHTIHSLRLCQASLLPPSLLEELVKSTEGLERLRRLKHVLWCGSALSSAAVGAKLRSYVTIYSALGQTESGVTLLTMEDQDDFEYMGFSELMGAQFRHYSGDLYEMVLVRDASGKVPQHIFLNFPELSEWPTKDLFSKHPTRDRLWRYRGRSDDLIIMLNALRVNPVASEGILAGHPKVTGALLTGTSREEVAWLIETAEPPTSDSEKASLIEEIWPTIMKANETGDAQSHAAKDMVVFTAKDKPMLRAGKGTIQRRLTVESYEAELDALYEAHTARLR